MGSGTLSEYVARIHWTATDSKTGATEGGLAEVGLDDVVIMRRDVPRAMQMLKERLAKLGQVAPSLEAFQKIHDEIESDPSSKDVIDYLDMKAIRLSPTYYITYVEHPAPDSLVGFGFSSGIGELPSGEGCGLTHSWDWFNVSGPDQAVKLQETGRLRIERVPTERQEITHMVFETDISMRITSRMDTEPGKVRWRIHVQAGSEIWWPTLVDDRNMPTGHVS